MFFHFANQIEATTRRSCRSNKKKKGCNDGDNADDNFLGKPENFKPAAADSSR